MGFATALAATAIATSAAGTVTSVMGAQSAAEASQGIAAAEMRLEEQRRKAMELDARRRMLETIRTQQRARATSLTTASNQGAQFGSGLQGGYGQIGGQTGSNLLGIFQNLDIGRNMFGINQEISGYKMQLAAAQGQQALGSGLSSFGSSLLQAGPQLNSLMGFGNPYK